MKQFCLIAWNVWHCFLTFAARFARMSRGFLVFGNALEILRNSPAFSLFFSLSPSPSPSLPFLSTLSANSPKIHSGWNTSGWFSGESVRWFIAIRLMAWPQLCDTDKVVLARLELVKIPWRFSGRGWKCLQPCRRRLTSPWMLARSRLDGECLANDVSATAKWAPLHSQPDCITSVPFSFLLLLSHHLLLPPLPSFNIGSVVFVPKFQLFVILLLSSININSINGEMCNFPRLATSFPFFSFYQS